MMNNNIKKQVTVTTNNNGEREDINMNCNTNSNTNNNAREENVMNNNNTETRAVVTPNNNEEKEYMNMNCNANNTPEIHTDNQNPETAPQPEANTAGTDNVENLDMLSSENLSAIIPKDEQAVTEADLRNQNKLVIVSVIEPADMYSAIPEEEREVVDDEVKKNMPELTEATKIGCFSPVRGMKGFITDTGHTIFARKFINLQGDSFLDYIQQYSNGGFSASMRIAQSDLMFLSMYGNTTDKESAEVLKNKAHKILLKITEDYCGKLLYPDEGLNMEAILNLLVSQYNSLPVEKEPAPLLERPRDLYAKVIEKIDKNWGKNCFEHNAYYALDDELIDILACDLNVEKKLLIKKMNEYHFLYLTESSKGYQTCVRIKPTDKYPDFFSKSHTKWCYCILNFEYIAEANAQRKAK